MAPHVGLTPTADLFFNGPLFTHSINAHIYKLLQFNQRVLGPLVERRHKQAKPSGSFFSLHLPQCLLAPYPVRSVWFEKVQLKSPGLGLYKQGLEPSGIASLSTDSCCVKSFLLDRRQ